MSVTFSAPVEIPVVTRESEPNPFTDHFPSDDKALPITLTAKTEDEVKAALTKVSGQARKAANAVDRSARVKADAPTGDTKKGFTVSALIWTVPKITRNRAANEASDSE